MMKTINQEPEEGRRLKTQLQQVLHAYTVSGQLLSDSTLCTCHRAIQCQGLLGCSNMAGDLNYP